MLATTTPWPKSNPHAMRFLPRSRSAASAANRIERQVFSRDAHLLDASIAGVVLSFNPRDDEMREKAERSWETIRAQLADHLFSEETAALPWNGDASLGSPTAHDL